GTTKNSTSPTIPAPDGHSVTTGNTSYSVNYRSTLCSRKVSLRWSLGEHLWSPSDHLTLHCERLFTGVTIGSTSRLRSRAVGLIDSLDLCASSLLFCFGVDQTYWILSEHLIEQIGDVGQL